MNMNSQAILVTGANKGIGLEICRQLAQLGHHVILSARSEERGRAVVGTLAKEGLKVDFLQLDTADETSIRAAASDLKKRIKVLNVLINNAAILDTWQGTILEATAAEIRETFITNALGPVLLVQALLPLLEAGRPARVINVSSQLGSVANMTDGWAGYGISKAALNAASPGWVRTEMGGVGAPLPVEKGAQNIVRLITEVPHSLTNHFLEANGEIPW